jgi:hypothetical protein
MIRPPRGDWRLNWAKAARAHRKAPVRLVSITARQSSSDRASISTEGAITPALLNNRSMRPKRATARANSRSTPSLDGRAHDIVCGQIDLGNARTAMVDAMAAHGSPQPDGALAVEPSMDVRHAAEAVVHMAALPLEANVQFMTVMASKMPYIGRG